jgi:hypothetical protein
MLNALNQAERYRDLAEGVAASRRLASQAAS